MLTDGELDILRELAQDAANLTADEDLYCECCGEPLDEADAVVVERNGETMNVCGDCAAPAPARPAVTVEPMIDDDGQVGGYAAFHGPHRVTAEFGTRRDAALAAEAAGFDPWLSDEEMDDEAQAIMHGSWLL
jgi:hypothetical protein